jgi:hypothetical protein
LVRMGTRQGGRSLCAKRMSSIYDTRHPNQFERPQSSYLIGAQHTVERDETSQKLQTYASTDIST